MTTVRLDLVEDTGVRHDAGGVSATRRVLVRQVTGTPTFRARNALLAPGLPRYGDPHPAWPDLRVVDISLTPIDVETWEGVISYRVPIPNELMRMEPDGTVIDTQWFATTITEEMNLDINGERLYHWYSGYPLTPNIIGSGIRFIRTLTRQLVWKNELAEVQRPSIGVRVVTVNNRNIQTLLPLSGGINANRWSGYPAQTWLIAGMDSRWEQGRWVNTVELFYRQDTWRFKSVVEYFGAPPDDATDGNGIAYFDVYPKVNFAGLGFGLS